MQEHICSAAPAVIEDYRETTALNRELEVRASNQLPPPLITVLCMLCQLFVMHPAKKPPCRAADCIPGRTDRKRPVMACMMEICRYQGDQVGCEDISTCVDVSLTSEVLCREAELMRSQRQNAWQA